MNNYIAAAIGVTLSYILSIVGIEKTIVRVPVKWRKTAEKRIMNVSWKSVVVLPCIALLVVLGVSKQIDEERIEKEAFENYVMICKDYFDNQNYGNAAEILIPHIEKEPKAKLIYGYFLIHGYAFKQDVDKGIECYKEAMAAGIENAESCLVVAAVEHYHDDRMIDIIKTAYYNGNNVAVRFVDEHLRQYKENTPTEKTIDADNNLEEFWSLPNETICDILLKDIVYWIESTKTYTHHVSPTSSANFTRMALGMSGNNYVYLERVKVVLKYPEWFSENVWQ